MNRIISLLWLAGCCSIATPSLGEEGASYLRWKNGDVLPGALKESTADEICWSSPLFGDDLIIDATVLDSIEFPRQPAQSLGDFRVITTSGAVFTADLLAADDGAFLFSSPYLGEVSLGRQVVYALDRLTHPQLFFDGSQASAWGVATPKGPIRNLTYRVYDGSHEWPQWIPGEIPDVSRLIPMANGLFPAGYLDLGLAELTDEFALVFTGQIEAAREGDYTFALSAQDNARLFVDGALSGVASTGRDAAAVVRLGAGFHELRVEYVKTVELREPKLEVKWGGAGFSDLSLVGINPPPGWRRGGGGHLQTDRSTASVFRGIELPAAFELDLELVSTENPRFVLGFGGDASNLALAPQPLRLETWDDELVLVQDTIFQQVMTIREGQRSIQLRLLFDGAAGEVQVFDAAGTALPCVKGVEDPAGRSGLFLRNRGKDLAVRRFRMYRRPPASATPPVDLSRPGVRLLGGRMVAGQIEVAEAGTTVIDGQGSRHAIDLDEVDRLVDPDAQLGEPDTGAELAYADGAVLRGRLEQVHPDRLVFRTGFTEQPVTCSLAGAASLEFELTAGSGPVVGGSDQLFFRDGQLRGRVSFGPGESPFAWRPDGVVRAARIGSLDGCRLERSGAASTRAPAFDLREFPHVLHLKNGEIIPCEVRSWDESTLGFRSPFVSGGEMKAAWVKAIEFKSPVKPDAEHPVARGGDNWLKAFADPQSEGAFGLEPMSLDRALTVPRFSRDNPPRHFLVAKTGDLMRGNLISISREELEFESKLRHKTVPLDLLAAVVEVSRPEDEPDGPGPAEANGEETVRATLTDGAVLEFEVLTARGGQLHGRSPVYGDMAIPTESIQRLVFGDFEREKRELWFESWVARPAKEPEFSEDPPAPIEPKASQAPSVSPPIAAAAPAKVPGLGLVRVDSRERTLRFPISINQRAGSVEYALVTSEGKTHESVFRTETEPTHIHLGLLLLGGTPAYVRELPVDPSRKLPGDPVAIEIAWTEDGVERRKPLEAFIVSAIDATTLTPGPWVFNGSIMIGNGLAAQSEGSIVALYLDPAALINNPRPGRENDELHRANPQAFSADVVQMEMVIRLAKDGQGPVSSKE